MKLSWSLTDLEAAAGNSGKSGGLHRMAQLRLPVPRTAIGTADFVHRWLRQYTRFDAFIGLWRRWPSDLEAEAAATALRSELATAPEPVFCRFSRDLVQGLRTLSPQAAVFVRSNINFESGAEGSLAGAFTSLPAERPEAFFPAIRSVIASVFETGALKRVLAEGFDPGRIQISFIVQPLLQPRWSGVCFSRSFAAPERPPRHLSRLPALLGRPLPAPEWGLMEASPHGPDAVTSGIAGEATTYSCRPEPPRTAWRPFWRKLWNAAAKLERHFGEPVDIEWLWDGKQLYFLQIRPVASPEIRILSRLRPEHALTRSDTMERFPSPVSPLGWSLLKRLLVRNLENLRTDLALRVKTPEEMCVNYRGVIYSDPRFFEWGRTIRPDFRGWLRLVLPSRAAGFDSDGDGIKAFLSMRAIGHRLFRRLLGNVIDRTDREFASLRASLPACLKRFNQGIDDEVQSSDGRDLLGRMQDLQDLSYRFHACDLRIYFIKRCLHAMLSKAAAGDPGLAMAVRAASRGEIPIRKHLLEFIRTLSASAEGGQALAAIKLLPPAAACEKLCTGSEAVRQAWEDLLNQCGGVSLSWDVMVPTLAEEPAHLVNMLRQLPDDSSEPGPTGPQTPSDVHPATGWMLEKLRNFIQHDDEQHQISGQFLVPTRKLIRQAARRLCQAGVIRSEAEAYFLDIEELQEAIQRPGVFLGFLTEKRRGTQFAEHDPDIPPNLPVCRPADAPVRPDGKKRGGLIGVPIADGSVTGRALVVRTLADCQHLQPGDIMVATAPNPALIPYFTRIGGLLTECGGPLSHGFIAAREYSLPAVSGLHRITATVRNGQIIKFDGGKGWVELTGLTAPATF